MNTAHAALSLSAYLHFKHWRPQDVFQCDTINHYGQLWRCCLV